MSLLLNGEVISVADSPAERADTSPEFEVAGVASAALLLTERDQTAPAGRFSFLATADTLVVQRGGVTVGTLVAAGGAWNVGTYADNALLSLGTDADANFVLRAAILGANTALTGVLVGTPVTPAVAANSLIFGNVTADGDLLIALQTGGNSQAYLFIDASAQTMNLMTAGVSRLLLSATPTVPDDTVWRFGTDGDSVIVHRTGVLAATTVLADVLVGTVVSADTPANSLLLSNITASGDIAFFVNVGGNSQEWLRFDASAGLLVVNEAGADVDVRMESTAGTGLANLFFLDAGAGRVGINTGTPLQRFMVNGNSQFTATMFLSTGENAQANANMSGGLNINKEGADNQAFAIQDTTDVGTGLTTITEVAVLVSQFFTVQKFAADTGGVLILALGENAAVTTNLRFASYGGQADTGAAATTSRGLVEFYASQHDGANALADVAANGIVLAVRARVGGADRTIATLDEDGDLFIDGSGGVNTVGGFDSYQDAALARAATHARTGRNIVTTRWDAWATYNEAKLVELGILGRPRSEGGLWNVTRHVQLLNDTVWQLWTEIMDIAAALDGPSRARLPEHIREKLPA